MGIVYRTATKPDCLKLAELIQMASAGVVEYLFHGLVPGMSATQVVADSLARDVYPHTYNSAIVATDGDEVVGMALSYPAAYHGITDEMKAFFPSERLDHMRAFYSERVDDSWYLDDLAVVASHRKRGIGQELLQRTKKKAIAEGFEALSLVVFAQNSAAISVYRREGFRVVRPVDLGPNEFIQYTDGALLLACNLAQQ